MSAVDHLVAGMGATWARRGPVLGLQGARAVMGLGPELLGLWALERGAHGLLLGCALAWVVIELSVGGWIDAETTRSLAGAPRTHTWASAARIARARVVLPLAVAIAPVAAMGLSMWAEISIGARAMVSALLGGMVATLVATGLALALHLRVAPALVTGDVASARRWTSAHRGALLGVSGALTALRFGAAWLATTVAHLVTPDPLVLWAAIAAVGVLTRPIAQATWVDVLRSEGSAPRR